MEFCWEKWILLFFIELNFFHEAKLRVRNKAKNFKISTRYIWNEFIENTNQKENLIFRQSGKVYQFDHEFTCLHFRFLVIYNCDKPFLCRPVQFQCEKLTLWMPDWQKLHSRWSSLYWPQPIMKIHLLTEMPMKIRWLTGIFYIQLCGNKVFHCLKNSVYRRQEIQKSVLTESAKSNESIKDGAYVWIREIASVKPGIHILTTDLISPGLGVCRVKKLIKNPRCFPRG